MFWDCSFPLRCVSHRTSLCLGRCPLVRFALLSCLLLALLFSLACCWLCSSLLPAVGSALSVLVIILQICDVLLTSSNICCFIRLVTGSLAVVPSLLLQCRVVDVYDSVFRFWLLPTQYSALRHFVIDGSRKVPSIHAKIVDNNEFCCLRGLV